MEGDHKMRLIKEADLTHGWCARMYDTGEMCISHDATSYHLTIPKESVDTLVNICQEVKAEQKEK
jgi:hypothetical protein